MKFRSKAIPGQAKGIVLSKITTVDDKGIPRSGKIVLPDQSMSLAEILERFTRGEKLPIGQEVQYHESGDDLEKISHMDLTEKEEFIEQQKETQKRFQRQEKARKKAAQDKLEREAFAKAKDALEAQKRAGDSTPPTPPAK